MFAPGFSRRRPWPKWREDPDMNPPIQTPTPSAPDRPAAQKETILVVEDDPDLRDLIVQVLESAGYRMLPAGSGVQALEQWAKRRGGIHLLLTDMVMPDGLTGRKLAEQLQSEDPRLRVIFTSGYAAGTPGTELANFEPRNFLPKPYRPGHAAADGARMPRSACSRQPSRPRSRLTLERMKAKGRNNCRIFFLRQGGFRAGPQISRRLLPACRTNRPGFGSTCCVRWVGPCQPWVPPCSP